MSINSLVTDPLAQYLPSSKIKKINRWFRGRLQRPGTYYPHVSRRAILHSATRGEKSSGGQFLKIEGH